MYLSRKKWTCHWNSFGLSERRAAAQQACAASITGEITQTRQGSFLYGKEDRRRWTEDGEPKNGEPKTVNRRRCEKTEKIDKTEKTEDYHNEKNQNSDDSKDLKEPEEPEEPKEWKCRWKLKQWKAWKEGKEETFGEKAARLQTPAPEKGKELKMKRGWSRELQLTRCILFNLVKTC